MWKKIIHKIYLHYRVRRLRRLINFFHVILGVVLVQGWRFNVRFVFEFIHIFLIFGVILYGALHTLNNIADRKEDQKSKRKAHRIVASGQLSVAELYLDVAISITTALVLLWLYYPNFIGFACAFIILNVCYSFFLKPIHHVVAMMVMSWSIPIRLMLGVAIADGNIWQYWMWYVFVWAGVVAEVSRKIQYEKRRYSSKIFQLLRFFLFFLSAVLVGKIFISGQRVSLLGIYSFYYLGYQVLFYYSPRVRRILYGVWTK